jgi:hypothetical protein
MEGAGSSWPSPHAFAYAELAVRLAICIIILRGRIGQWHEKWIDYRALAERLRRMMFLIPLGRSATSDADGWVEWFHRAVVRDAALVTARFDASYLSDCRALLAECELDRQVHYHESLAHRMHRLHLGLHWIGTAFFFAAALCAVGELVAESTWFSWFAVTLPAFGAGLHGIESQGDFQGLSERSRSLEHTFARYREAARALSTPTSASLGALAEEVANLFEQEQVDWRAAAERKPLGFPA